MKRDPMKDDPPSLEEMRKAFLDPLASTARTYFECLARADAAEGQGDAVEARGLRLTAQKALRLLTQYGRKPEDYVQAP